MFPFHTQKHFIVLKPFLIWFIFFRGLIWRENAETTSVLFTRTEWWWRWWQSITAKSMESCIWRCRLQTKLKTPHTHTDWGKWNQTNPKERMEREKKIVCVARKLYVIRALSKWNLCSFFGCLELHRIQLLFFPHFFFCKNCKNELARRTLNTIGRHSVKDWQNIGKCSVCNCLRSVCGVRRNQYNDTYPNEKSGCTHRSVVCNFASHVQRTASADTHTPSHRSSERVVAFSVCAHTISTLGNCVDVNVRVYRRMERICLSTRLRHPQTQAIASVGVAVAMIACRLRRQQHHIDWNSCSNLFYTRASRTHTQHWARIGLRLCKFKRNTPRLTSEKKNYLKQKLDFAVYFSGKKWRRKTWIYEHSPALVVHVIWVSSV